MGISIAVIIIGSISFKINPFFTLLIASLIVGFGIGRKGMDVLQLIEVGFGSTVGKIGIIITLGTLLGKILEKVGATTDMANTIIHIMKPKRVEISMNIIGLLISIPVFCDSAFVILSSINKSLSRKTGIPITAIAISLASGLFVSHVFIPPTPGPLIAASVLGADVGMVLVLGILVAVPTAMVGCLWARLSSSPYEKSNFKPAVGEGKYSGAWKPFIPILIPIILIGANSYVSKYTGESTMISFLIFLGNPMTALSLGVGTAWILFWDKVEGRSEWVSHALKDAGHIILITGAGGAFGSVLQSLDLESSFDFLPKQVGLLFPYFLATFLKVAQGSSTVSIITASGVIAGIMPQLGIDSEIGRVLAVLAIGAGAMTGSHVNDSYFWVISQFSQIDTKSMIKTHTTATVFQGLTGILIIFLLDFLFSI